MKNNLNISEKDLLKSFNPNVKSIKVEFENFLEKLNSSLKYSTINTYQRDAFYVYRHFEHSLFWKLLISKQNIEEFEPTLLEHQKTFVNKSGKKIKKPSSSTKAYIKGLLSLHEFFNKKYDGIENYMQSWNKRF
jgi:hypothetical protein